MIYKVKCENEENHSWVVWIKANSLLDAEDKALDDPNVSGCEVIGIKEADPFKSNQERNN